MSYVRKNIQSIINNADTCGGGMKKQGLVYGSDWAKLSSGVISSKTSINYAFTIYGQATKNCCSSSSRTTLGGYTLNRGTQRAR